MKGRKEGRGGQDDQTGGREAGRTDEINDRVQVKGGTKKVKREMRGRRRWDEQTKKRWMTGGSKGMEEGRRQGGRADERKGGMR
jgi:hypothetical protein